MANCWQTVIRPFLATLCGIPGGAKTIPAAGSNRAQGNVSVAAAGAGVAFKRIAFAAAAAAAKGSALWIDVEVALAPTAAFAALPYAGRAAAATFARSFVIHRSINSRRTPNPRTSRCELACARVGFVYDVVP